MKVVLPLAGRGSRLSPLTDQIPKALVEVDGHTLLEWTLAPVMALRADLVTEIIFVVGWRGELLEKWYGGRYGWERYDRPLHVTFQSTLNGQAGAIASVADRLHGPVLILFCDTLHDADIVALAKLGQSESAPDGVLHVKFVEDPSRFGVAVIDSDSYVKQLVEKPSRPISNLGIVGVYWVKDGAWLARAVDTLMTERSPIRGEYFLADALQIMIDEGARFEARPVERWLDCGTLDGLHATELSLQAERRSESATASVRFEDFR